MQRQDTYKEVKMFQSSNAVVRVHIPDLAEDERKARLETIKKSAEKLLKGQKNNVKHSYSTNNS